MPIVEPQTDYDLYWSPEQIYLKCNGSMLEGIMKIEITRSITEPVTLKLETSSVTKTILPRSVTVHAPNSGYFIHLGSEDSSQDEIRCGGQQITRLQKIKIESRTTDIPEVLVVTMTMMLI